MAEAEQTKLTIDSSMDEEECVEKLNSMGQNLIELEIHDASNSLGFYQVISGSVGEQIRKFILFRENLTEELLQTLEPLLQHLDELELHIINDCNDALELHSRCPNLKSLHIQWNTPFTNTENWPHLEQFTLGDNEFISDEQFREFMENNPQLKKLKIGCFNCDVQLEDIAQCLINLEELIIFQNYSNLTADNILELQKLPHLKRLILRNVASDIEDIMDVGTQLKGLTELQLQVEVEPCTDAEYFDLTSHRLPDIAREMPRLEVFGISYCKLENRVFLEFLRLAEDLKEMHIHECDFQLTADTINAIIEVRSENSERNDPLIIHTEHLDDDILDVSLHLKSEHWNLFSENLFFFNLLLFPLMQLLEIPEIRAKIHVNCCDDCEIIRNRIF